MQERYGYVVGFIIAVFLTISFLITAIVSLLDPVLSFEFVQVNPLFSWMNPIAGYVVHLIGNIFFCCSGNLFCIGLLEKIQWIIKRGGSHDQEAMVCLGIFAYGSRIYP